MVPLEIEAKLPVPSLEPVRRALAEASAAPLGRVLETNHILDSADGHLGRAGSALRLRVNQPIEGGPAATILTYKGPVQAGKVKRRPEIEVQISDPARALELLAALSFVEVMVYRKRRESHRLADCRVELDEVPFLGCFVEVEGPDEAAISQVQERLGLSAVPHQPKSYVALLRDHCRRTGCDPRRIDFPQS